MKALQLLQGKHGALAAKIMCGALAVFFLIALPSSAQNRVMSSNQGEGDGVQRGREVGCVSLGRQNDGCQKRPL